MNKSSLQVMTQYETLRAAFSKTPAIAQDDSGEWVLLTARQADQRIKRATATFETTAVHFANRSLANFAKLPDGNREVYTATDIMRIANIRRSTLNQWTKLQLVTPSKRDSGGGARNERWYSFADAYLAGVLGDLHRKGIKPSKLKSLSDLIYGLVGGRLEPETKSPDEVKKSRKKRRRRAGN